MEIQSLAIPDVLLLKPSIFGDERGFFTETFRQSWLSERGLDLRFVQDNLSRSKKGTLRGLHYQITQAQAKLVTVLSGAVLDVAVDIRKGSPTFGQHIAIELNDQNRYQLLIPEGFAHGFQVLSSQADFYYKCSDYYFPQGERGIAYDDPKLAIRWNSISVILSSKDQHHPRLEQVPAEDLPKYETLKA